jgi:hypothetical protein
MVDRGSLQARFGIEVPGAYVGLDPYRGRSKFLYWIKDLGLGFLTLGYSAFTSGLPQDVVVRDSANLQEIYREGPLARGLAILAMNRYAAEIRETGLDHFLRQRQVDNAQIGPGSSPERPVNLRRPEPHAAVRSVVLLLRVA